MRPRDQPAAAGSLLRRALGDLARASQSTCRPGQRGLHEPTHFATSFDHLGSNGYAAAYYTYQWSQVISKDLWSAFHPERPFDPRPARSYRDLVLRPGGGKPAAELVRSFLGRPFGFESWKRWLEGGGAAATP